MNYQDINLLTDVAFWNLVNILWELAIYFAIAAGNYQLLHNCIHQACSKIVFTCSLIGSTFLQKLMLDFVTDLINVQTKNNTDPFVLYGHSPPINQLNVLIFFKLTHNSLLMTSCTSVPFMIL